MRIELKFRVQCDGLAGGDLESAPYMGVRATFGTYRQPLRVALVQQPTAPAVYTTEGAVGPYVLDHVADEVRGDESFWLEMFAHTNTSGIEEIDKTEKGYVKRNVKCGTLQLPLGKLLAAVNPTTCTGTIEHEDMVDTELLTFLLTSERANQVQPDVPRALKNAHKAWLSVDVRVLDCTAPALQALVTKLAGPLNAAPETAGWVRNCKTGALLYVPANYAKFAKQLDYFVNLYADRYIGHIDSKTGQISGKPKFDTDNENIKGLHFAIYRSQVGMLPIIAFWAHAYMQRHWASDAARTEASKLYGQTLATETYFDAKLAASCRRYGMTPASYMGAIAEQLARGAGDATVSSAYRTAIYVTADFGTFTANSISYSQDQRFANAKRDHTPDEPDFLKGDKPIGLESWDITGLTLMTNENDCEDMGNVSTSGLRSLAFGREDVPLEGAATAADAANEFKRGGWTSPLLKSAQRVLEQYCMLDAGGAVTAAYIGADGKKLEKKDIKDLPMKGDAADRRNTTGGHAYGIMVPEARAAMWLANGGITDQPLGAKKYALWQYRQPVPLLEGTGPIEHGLLPEAELAEGGERSIDYKKAEAARAFVRGTLSDESYKPFLEAFHPYSVPFYAKRVEPDRRVTTFYREAVHAGSADMYMRHRGLSQLTFVDKHTGQRGIDTAMLARDGADGDPAKSRVVLDAPFYRHVREWNANMVPVMEAMVNQMPLTALAQVPSHRQERPLHFGLLSHATLQQRLASDSLSARSPLWLGTPVNSTGAPTATAVAAPASVDSVRALSPWAAEIAATLTDAKRSPVRGTVHWDSLYHALAWYGGRVDTGAAHDKSAPVLEATAVEYAMPPAVDAHAALTNSGVSWDVLQGGASGASVRGLSRRFTVLGAAVHRAGPGTSGGMELVVDLGENVRVPVAADTLTLLHLNVYSRIFALAPIVLAAAGTGHTLLNTARSANSGSYIRSATRNSVDDTWRVTVALPSALHVAQAFCTRECVTSAPWITPAMNASVPTLPASAVAADVLGFNLGAPQDLPALSPFVDCYKRTDAVMVRFLGHEWSLRKNHDAALACIDRLYKSGVLLAHEFALCSPLPQCDDVLELHMLIKV